MPPGVRKPKSTPSKPSGFRGSADSIEQRNWSQNAAERNVFPTAIGFGEAVAAQNRLLQAERRQQDIDTWNAAAARSSGGGSSSRRSSGGGGGGGYRGGGGGGGGGGPDPRMMAAYQYMLNDFNWGGFEKPFNAQLIAGVTQRDAAKADVARIDTELRNRLAALGPNPYANMQAPAQVGSAQGSAGALQQYLASQGVGGNQLSAMVNMRGQAETDDLARLRAMYQMLNASGQADAQSRTAQASFANAGAERQLGDQWTQFTTALQMAKLNAEQEARNRLIQFALENGIKPEGMTR